MPSTPRPAPAEVAGWGLVLVLAAGWLALVEIFWLPLRIGGVLVPVSVVAAVVGNLLLVELALRCTRSRAVAVLPALTWLAVVLTATRRRPEGDLVLVGTGTLGTAGLVFLMVGVVAAAVAVGQVLARPAPSRRGTPSAPSRRGTPFARSRRGTPFARSRRGTPSARSGPVSPPGPGGSGSGGAR